ncbi:MAG TPA: hypothetical protein VLH56_03655 [Dissulfurispiraceae bacterium]|nr:hypothetical protein [Dissulfurispiraceae bacterium]
MYSLDALSWEPRITKHPPHYDDPWRYNCNDTNSLKELSRPHASIAKRKPMLVHDVRTLKTTDHVSLADAASSIGVNPGQVRQSAANGWMIAKRYICGYTIESLFANMKKQGIE